MVISSFKCTFEKRDPKEVTYRDYRHFNTIVFRSELQGAIQGSVDWADYELRFLNVINKHAPVKKKTVRANHKP